MINESPRQIKAYWFFTPKTIPDKELLGMLNNDKHEVGLHVVNKPLTELKELESSTGRKIRYFTRHGTARLLTRFMWGRWQGSEPTIPKGFPLKPFAETSAIGIDKLCFACPPDQVARMAENHIEKGSVLYFHPIWLFQKGKLNHRGPFYQAFREILAVDAELDLLAIRKKLIVKIARDQREYERSVIPRAELFQKLSERGADVFEFLERSWCRKVQNPDKSWAKSEDNVALLHLSSYDEWWKNIDKKTRNIIRKAEKSGITTSVAQPDEKLAEGIWKIWNETPIRQDRGFPHYGASLEEVKRAYA